MASTDRDALVALYRSTGGAGWFKSDDWDTGAGLATWFGVEVNDQGRVVRLFLNKNNLQGPIPEELGVLTELKEAWLNKNQLTGHIPPQIGNLSALEHLHLGDNKLDGPISPELGSLTELEVLVLERNKLSGGIPPELGSLAALQYLYLGRNQLSGTIPAKLGSLTALDTLALGGNKLCGSIPTELGNLRALHYLDLGGNRLNALWDHTQDTQDAGHNDRGYSMLGSPLPSRLRRLLGVLRGAGEEGFTLFLNGNPWVEPPESIVAEGPRSIRSYFEDLYTEPCRIKRSSVKVVLVGQEGAGKTSLRRSMKANEATPTGEWKEESTVFADVEPMELEGSSVRVYDCAGQVAYTGLLQMFLTPRSVCVLVCDAGALGQQLHSENNDQVEEDCRKLEELRVCEWLRSISRRVPDNDVVLVATKCDLAGGNAREIGVRMEHACRAWLSSWVRHGMQPVQLETGVSLTSCFVAGGVGEHGESSTGDHASKAGWSDGGGLRGAQMVLPQSWDMALTVLEALEHGRDPVQAVLRKSPGPDRGNAAETAGGKTSVFQGITVEDLSTKWDETVGELKQKGITVTNAKNALKGALSIREFDGSLVRHEKFVFLDVVWLARILKPLLNHKDQETFDGRVNLGDTGDTRITLDDASDIASWDRLKNEGVLEPRLAYAMWPNGLCEYVLPTLASLGLTFPLENDPDGGLVVLLRLEPDRPEIVGNTIDTFCSGHTPAFSVSWKIFLGVPPGAIEKVLTRCCGLGGVRTFWRYGVLVHGGLGVQDEHRTFALVTPVPWVALSFVMSSVSLMLLDFPGLSWKGSLKCPQHGDAMLFVNKATRSGDKFLEGSRCPRCSPDTGGLGAAAIDLVRMVDIRLDRDLTFSEVKARFVILEGQYSFTCPPGSSTDEDELIRKIDGVAIAVTGGLNEVKAEMKEGFDGTKTELRDVKDGLGMITARLDKVLESTQESLARLKNLQAPNYHYPRLVVVKEVGYDGTSPKAHGKKSMLSKLRGLGKKDMRLHFLCPVDMTKVPCGPGGDGYRFQETRSWVKKISPVLQVAVVTAKVALNATIGLNVDISDFLKDGALLRVMSGEESVSTGMQRDTSASYEALKKFMDKEGLERRKVAKDSDGYIDFRDEMKRVTDGRGGVVWVRNENVPTWLDSLSITAPTS
ncbi:LRR-GTPase of the ROCO family, putative pseudogene [Ectocarpus siliculosus]|nr:LRR-GTPase of the ROCO family, putative pseudogene [Ectocarpus siliculosus]|eukprot:CBJ27067.1 LRR-GTPase of the ROCO family, putative pseudogene [Ectocarpus siliculosus]